MNSTVLYAISALTLVVAFAGPLVAFWWRVRRPGATALRLVGAAALGGIAAGAVWLMGAAFVVARLYAPDLQETFATVPLGGAVFGVGIGAALVVAHLVRRRHGSAAAFGAAVAAWGVAMAGPLLVLHAPVVGRVRGTVYVGGPSATGAGAFAWRREAGVLVFVDRDDGVRKRMVLDSTGTLDIVVAGADRPHSRLIICKPGYQARMYAVPPHHLGRAVYLAPMRAVWSEVFVDWRRGVPEECGAVSSRGAAGDEGSIVPSS